MVAQAKTGTPGHINSLAIAGAHLVRHFRRTLQAGRRAHHQRSLAVGRAFLRHHGVDADFAAKLIGYIGSTIHHTDIGGYGIGAGARDVHEEGLWIPPLKLYNAGEPMPGAARHDPPNVRTPDAVFGDLAAQVSSGQAASERLIALCERYGLDDIEELSDEIIKRSEEATRAAIRKLKAGTYHGESRSTSPAARSSR